ncbi:MAG: hypothetical protein U9N54_10440 [candidate division Zixibacteria bacterium]|nr:hypothetical protein [candidate division Zixibacteria bacterium]
MIKLDLKYRLIALGVIVIALVMMISINYTDAFQLERVYLDGKELTDWGEELDGIDSGVTIKQSLESAAKSMLSKKGIFRIDMAIRTPNEIEIMTNDFKPFCFVLDKSRGELLGLNENGRIIPLTNNDIDWECPVITGVKVKKIFHRSENVRLVVLLDELKELHDNHLDLFRTIEEIDISNDKYVKVQPDGLDYYLKIRPDNFNKDMERFVEFMENYYPETEYIRSINFCNDKMIVCQE